MIDAHVILKEIERLRKEWEGMAKSAFFDDRPYFVSGVIKGLSLTMNVLERYVRNGGHL